MTVESAPEIAQQYGIADSASFPGPREIETRGEFCDKWRGVRETAAYVRLS